MSVELRRADDRGSADFGWLQARYSFSFAYHYDPEHMGHGLLRVLNQDLIAGGRGFDPHSHRDMEIVTFILQGSLRHKDSMGNEAVIRPGDVQRMSAGSGVTHSEYNDEPSATTEVMQIWIETAKPGIAPEYEQKSLHPAIIDQFPLLVSPDGEAGSITLHQQAWISGGTFEPDTHARLELRNKFAYVHMAHGSGKLLVGGRQIEMNAGDGCYIRHEDAVEFSATGSGHLLVLDVPEH